MKILGFKTISAGVLCLFVLTNCTGVGQMGGQSWDKDRDMLLKNISSRAMNVTQKCDEHWNILWPWSKKGNLEARALLAGEIFANRRIMPGSGEDDASITRDSSILSIHALGADMTKTEGNSRASQRFALEMYNNATAQNILPYSERLNHCIQNTPSQKCADMAVQDHVIPSFDKLAADIDRKVSNGAKSVCRGPAGQ